MRKEWVRAGFGWKFCEKHGRYEGYFEKCPYCEKEGGVRNDRGRKKEI